MIRKLHILRCDSCGNDIETRYEGIEEEGDSKLGRIKEDFECHAFHIKDYTINITLCQSCLKTLIQFIISEAEEEVLKALKILRNFDGKEWF